jgi:hypothetical protein
MNVILIGAVAIVLGTVLGAPSLTPVIVGAAIGYLRPVRAARDAFAAGVIGWGALLVVAAIRGGAIGALSGKLGEILGLPGVVMIVVTLLYPAVLAAAAAWLVATIRSRRGEAIDSVRP